MSSYLDQDERGSEEKPFSWNRLAALENVGGDEVLLDEVVQLFLVESPKLVAKMEQALLHDDRRMLEMAAHSLRGELGYLAVPEAYEATQKLETAGRTGEIEAAADLVAGLRTGLAGLWATLSENTGT
jgi:HPt (histidine-containing phosphotransfer) domain-containing protein